MAPLGAPPALLGLLVLAAALGLLAAQGGANAIQDCCLKVPLNPRPFTRRLQNQFVAYRLQGPEMGCRREAIVFITKKERQLCVSPEADWAPALMEKIDRKPGASRRGA